MSCSLVNRGGSNTSRVSNRSRGVWHCCSNRSRGLLLEEIRYISFCRPYILPPLLLVFLCMYLCNVQMVFSCWYLYFQQSNLHFCRAVQCGIIWYTNYVQPPVRISTCFLSHFWALIKWLNVASKGGNLLFWGTLLPQKPKIGRNGQHVKWMCQLVTPLRSWNFMWRMDVASACVTRGQSPLTYLFFVFIIFLECVLHRQLNCFCVHSLYVLNCKPEQHRLNGWNWQQWTKFSYSIWCLPFLSI